MLKSYHLYFWLITYIFLQMEKKPINRLLQKKKRKNYDHKNSKNYDDLLTLIWVGFLEVRFEVGGGGQKLTPPPLSKTR